MEKVQTKPRNRENENQLHIQSKPVTNCVLNVTL